MILVGDVKIRDNSYRTTVDIGDTGMYTVALADGMGGHLGGEKASEMVLDSLKIWTKKEWAYMNASSFNELSYYWLEHINRSLEYEGYKNPHYEGMGTTLVAFVVNYGDCYWINCGDSRIYRFRAGRLTQLSNDHSLSNLMGDHTHTGMIINCIGAGCTSSYLDLVEFGGDIMAGDVLLLCSDGLTDMVSNEELEMLLRGNATAKELCRVADEAGGRDNTSVCIIKVVKK